MSTDTSLPAEPLAWLAEFEARHGRPLRVLHVGNIANNAYLNAKFLRKVGVEADVMCQDYFHVMACPEWEELEITEPFGDDNAPVFSPLDIRGYRRPSWFIQDSLIKSVDIIRDKFVRSAIFSRNGDGSEAAPAPILEDVLHSVKMHAGKLDQEIEGKLARAVAELGVKLDAAQQSAERASHLQQLNFQKLEEVFVRMQQRAHERATARLRSAAADAWREARQNPQLQAIYRRSGLRRLRRGSLAGAGEFAAAIDPATSEQSGSPMADAGPSAQLDPILAAMTNPPPSASAFADRQRLEDAVRDFATAFPNRADKLTVEDIRPFMDAADLFRLAFEPYDIVQLYATHPIFGYLAGNKPYVGYEHGTLRTFTMEDYPLHRLTALGYRRADHVFITNGDCLDYAQRLGITSYSPMIHPVDVDQHRTRYGEPGELKKRLNADVLLFCPLRHDWTVKGTDTYLRALPLLRAKVPGRLVLVLTRWGQDLEASRTLIAGSGCNDLVVWAPPLSRITMIKLMQAADVVLDQIALPHFGQTAPQALAAGTPVISSYKPESTSWIVSQPAPILPAFSPEEVVRAIRQALDPDWRARFKDRTRQWVDTEHHQERLVSEHLRVYQEILKRRRDDG